MSAFIKINLFRLRCNDQEIRQRAPGGSAVLVLSPHPVSKFRLINNMITLGTYYVYDAKSMYKYYPNLIQVENVWGMQRTTE